MLFMRAAHMGLARPRDLERSSSDKYCRSHRGSGWPPCQGLSHFRAARWTACCSACWCNWNSRSAVPPGPTWALIRPSRAPQPTLPGANSATHSARLDTQPSRLAVSHVQDHPDHCHLATAPSAHIHFVRETNEPTTNVGGHSRQSKGFGFKTPHQAIKTGKVMWLGAFL